MRQVAAAQVTCCLLRYCSSRVSSDFFGSSFPNASIWISLAISGFWRILTERTDITTFIKTHTDILSIKIIYFFILSAFPQAASVRQAATFSCFQIKGVWWTALWTSGCDCSFCCILFWCISLLYRGCTAATPATNFYTFLHNFRASCFVHRSAWAAECKSLPSHCF